MGYLLFYDIWIPRNHEFSEHVENDLGVGRGVHINHYFVGFFLGKIAFYFMFQNFQNFIFIFVGVFPLDEHF